MFDTHSPIAMYVLSIGNFDPEAFNGLPGDLQQYGLFLTCLYMMVVVILMLNLLIALMGDSFTQVAENGLAQWRLEQSKIILANADLSISSLQPPRDRNTNEPFTVVYYEHRKIARESTPYMDQREVKEEEGGGSRADNREMEYMDVLNAVLEQQKALQASLHQMISSKQQ